MAIALMARKARQSLEEEKSASAFFDRRGSDEPLRTRRRYASSCPDVPMIKSAGEAASLLFLLRVLMNPQELEER
jgi:hypothetical protein